MSFSPVTPIRVAPTAGTTTLLAPFDGTLQSVFIVPAGLLAVLTISLPPAVDGQIVRICSTQAVTLLNVSAQMAQGGTTLPTVNNNTISMAINSYASWSYSAIDNVWLKSG
jgi:hypothetical protein